MFTNFAKIFIIDVWEDCFRLGGLLSLGWCSFFQQVLKDFLIQGFDIFSGLILVRTSILQTYFCKFLIITNIQLLQKNLVFH